MAQQFMKPVTLRICANCFAITENSDRSRFEGISPRSAGWWSYCGHRADFGVLNTSRVCLSQYLRVALNLFTYMGYLQRHMIRCRRKPIGDNARARVLAATEKTLTSERVEVSVSSPLAQTSVSAIQPIRWGGPFQWLERHRRSVRWPLVLVRLSLP